MKHVYCVLRLFLFQLYFMLDRQQVGNINQWCLRFNSQAVKLIFIFHLGCLIAHFSFLNVNFCTTVSSCCLKFCNGQAWRKAKTSCLIINIPWTQWWAQIFKYYNILIKWPSNIICIFICAISPVQIFLYIHS